MQKSLFLHNLANTNIFYHLDRDHWLFVIMILIYLIFWYLVIVYLSCLNLLTISYVLFHDDNNNVTTQL